MEEYNRRGTSGRILEVTPRLERDDERAGASASIRADAFGGRIVRALSSSVYENERGTAPRSVFRPVRKRECV